MRTALRGVWLAAHVRPSRGASQASHPRRPRHNRRLCLLARPPRPRRGEARRGACAGRGEGERGRTCCAPLQGPRRAGTWAGGQRAASGGLAGAPRVVGPPARRPSFAARGDRRCLAGWRDRLAGRLDARAIEATGGYVSLMTERVAELLERVHQLSAEEREEFEQALLARPEQGDEADSLDDGAEDEIDAEFADELGRRLRAARASGTTGEPAGPFLAELRASLRAKSA